jgi:GAF domain-containing protein
MAPRDPLDLTDGGRLRRLEALDELLPTLAGVLDVREVFVRISEIAGRVLPHDFLTLPIVEADNEHVLVYARSTEMPVEVPRRVRIPDPSVLVRPWDYMIFPDIREDSIEKNHPPAKLGYRSLLRLPLRFEGQLLGALHFFSFAVDFYQTADVLIGRRVADHVLLALWHARLAEQAKRAETLRARHASLTMLDGLLGTLTGVLDTRETAARARFIRHSESAGGTWRLRTTPR